MDPKKKAAETAFIFLVDSINDPELPAEMRRKCAEMILSLDAANVGETQPSQTVAVTYQVIE
ncbi:MAG: hypothetical protein FWH16_04370 [Oscillospiraceae bacterium]|nr:hypothetical protein [Oscillospiraceae bacterium]